MPEVETDETHAHWHPPEAEKPSRWRGALNAAGDFGNKAREAAVGAAVRGKEAMRNFDAGAALAQARERVQNAAERGMETATEAKDRIVAQFEDGRLHQLLETVQDVFTSPEAMAILRGLPFAAGAIQLIEAGKGRSLQNEKLDWSGRIGHAVGGARSLAVDATGGEVWKTAKIGAMLLELSPDILARIGTALSEKQIRGADTIATLADFLQKHPGITGFFKRKLTGKR